MTAPVVFVSRRYTWVYIVGTCSSGYASQEPGSDRMLDRWEAWDIASADHEEGANSLSMTRDDSGICMWFEWCRMEVRREAGPRCCLYSMNSVWNLPCSIICSCSESAVVKGEW
jgi:hypothetical protein